MPGFPVTFGCVVIITPGATGYGNDCRNIPALYHG